MTEEEKRQSEQEELNLLLERGLAFTVTQHRSRRTILGKRKTWNEEKRYIINQPTLATLDRLAVEQLDLVINEDKLTGADMDAMAEARRLAHENAERMARIVAIAVLGEDMWDQKHGRRTENQQRLQALTADLYHSINPQKLQQLCTAIMQMANLGDFCVSMRLMSAQRTTAPMKDRVE